MEKFEDASAQVLQGRKRPTIRRDHCVLCERKIGLVMFTGRLRGEMGARRIANEEVADAARENPTHDGLLPALIRTKAKWGARSRRLLKDA